ncbi:MAG: ATP-dependent RecD-like DNA helicase [Lachnospiraceae bacterium]|nr:ATP-dependent RecD-like DNA helicase [Lachnospiraceae bacterium]
MEEEIFIGYVQSVIYQKPESGFMILSLQDESGENELVVKGSFFGITEGENLRVEGRMVDDPTYGPQMNMETYEVLPPSDKVSALRYLGSGAIKGVGEKLAERIVKKFKNDTMRIIDEEPERLADIKGVSLRLAQSIGEQMAVRKMERSAMMFLLNFGIGDKMAVKIYKRYGDDVYDVLNTNPYRLAEDVEGIGFIRADEIVKANHLEVDPEYRVRCGILYVLNEVLSEGHTCIEEEHLCRRASDLLRCDEEEARTQLGNLSMDQKVIIKAGEAEVPRVYPPVAYYAESQIASLLMQLNDSSTFFDRALDPERENRLTEELDSIEDETGLILDAQQKQAVLQAATSGVTIITGGPGTGKTTTVNALIRLLEREEKTIVLTAPTGRAAKRMTEACGREAKTIHRLLEAVGGEERVGGFHRNEENPLEVDAVIVDEMSMVDIFLFRSLLRALTEGTRLVLVGDVDQLPSVGAGCVLRDLIDSGVFHTVVLTTIFRQAQKSRIVTNAHRIHRGELPELDGKENETDFFFVERTQKEGAILAMERLLKENFPRKFKIDPMEIQVLSPMKKGDFGVANINRFLQESLNPPAKEKREKVFGDVVFREGDKVMQIKNNYQLEWVTVGRYGEPLGDGVGVYNGDVGVIRKINEYSEIFEIEFDEGRRVRYPFGNLDELELAYAVTIHKSQGSEYPVVILTLIGVPSQLTYRNLLYTAVTRARQCVLILGDRAVMERMIQTASNGRRNTGLRDKILALAHMQETEGQ